MKSFTVLLVIMFYTLASFAKLNDTILVKKDTINLRGFIYNDEGQPAKHLIIESRQRDFKFNQYFLITQTDTTGYFEFKGAKPNDTLQIMDTRYDYVPFLNQGSRFMIIYLPKAKVAEINSSNPIEIAAKRRYPKTIPTFSITREIIMDAGCWLYIYPEFPGGQERFINFIKQTLIYPEKAIIHNIEGTVEVAFTIAKDGTLTDIKIIKGIGYGCEKQVVEILEKCPKWRPGIFCGRPSTTVETVSVKFSLTDK